MSVVIDPTLSTLRAPRRADAGAPPSPAESGLAKFNATGNAIKAVEPALQLTGNHGLSRANPRDARRATRIRMQHGRDPHAPRFIEFVRRFGALVEAETDDGRLRERGSALLRELVAHDDWLGEDDARPDPRRYRQNLLHLDPARRFSVVAFVWGAGQETPIHDHTVWGLIGMLRGAETSQGYRFAGATTMVADGPPMRIEPGQVEAVGPRIGDVHRVRNAFDDRVSISIHVYGGDIGAVERGIYFEDGTRRPFVSGYSPPWTARAHPDDIPS